MSWDAYIDNLLAYTRDAAGESHGDKAAIIGLDGNFWTSPTHPSGQKILTDEAQNISRCFKNSDFTFFMSNGIKLNGTKYQFLREEEGKVVYGRCKGNGAIAMQRTKQAVVIGHSPEGKQPGNLNKGVAAIAEYLEGLSF